MTENLDNAIAEGLSLCHGVVQRYIAYTQDMTPESLFEKISETNQVTFKDSNEKKWHLKFDIVDKNYMFDISKCNAKVVRDTMVKMIENLRATLYYVVESELTDQKIKEKIKHPEYLENSKFMISPHTTMFLYNDKLGRGLYEKFDKHIGFMWG
jgi:hypothetical protein